MNPALNGSSALERFKCGNAIEICNRIMFNFYLGLPHVQLPYLLDQTLWLLFISARNFVRLLFKSGY